MTNSPKHNAKQQRSLFRPRKQRSTARKPKTMNFPTGSFIFRIVSYNRNLEISKAIAAAKRWVLMSVSRCQRSSDTKRKSVICLATVAFACVRNKAGEIPDLYGSYIVTYSVMYEDSTQQSEAVR